MQEETQSKNPHIVEESTSTELRKSFDLSYSRVHPSPTKQIKDVEEALIADCIDNLIPLGKPKMVTGAGGLSYGPFYDRRQDGYEIPIPGEEPVKMKFSGSVPQTATVVIEQGNRQNPRGHDGYFFSHVKLITPHAAAAQFLKGWGGLVPDFIERNKVKAQLFPDITNDDLILQSDVRTKLPEGTRGQLRGGFAQELSFRYLNTLLQVVNSKSKLKYVLDILSGDGRMDDIYATFQQAKKHLQKQYPGMVGEEIASRAAKAIRPYKDWGFTKFRVVELPEDVYKLVLISAERE